MLKKKNYGTKSKLVLATGAHYDDVETGVGGTLLKHIERGDYVIVAIMSADEFRTGDIKLRTNEQIQALKKMGLPSERLLNFKMNTNQSDIINELDRINPDIIYTPYYRDTHQDHRRCSEISQSVGRKRNITTMFYYCGSSIEFYPNLFSFIDFEKKMELINCFTSQIDCGALKLDRRQKMEAYWASVISDDEDTYAEGLIIRKMIYEV